MNKKEKILEIISQIIGAKLEELQDPNTKLEDLGMDSLDRFEVVNELEVEFNLNISDEDMDRWVMIGDVIKYFEKE